MTGGAYGLSAVACEHHAVLYLVLVGLDHVEEVVDADSLVVLLNPWTFMPQVVLLLLCEVVVWLEYGEVVLWRTAAELGLPFAHLVTAPAEHGAVVHAQQLVGDDKVFVNAYYAAEALAVGAGADGRVEREHLLRGLLELNAVGLEAYAETVRRLLVHELQQAGAVAFIKGCLGRVEQAACRLVAVANGKAVNEQGGGIALLWGVLLNAYDLLVEDYACETLLQVDLQLLLKRASLACGYGCKQHEPCALGAALHAFEQVLGIVLLHKLSADGRVCLADACIQQLEIFIYFGRCSYR